MVVNYILKRRIPKVDDILLEETLLPKTPNENYRIEANSFVLDKSTDFLPLLHPVCLFVWCFTSLGFPLERSREDFGFYHLCNVMKRYKGNKNRKYPEM